MELFESSIAVFRNGGWFGVGTSNSEFLNISTTWSIDGLREAEACVQSKPIWKTLDASASGKSSPKLESTLSTNVFDL
jgi:hypothetical protein